MLGDAGNFMRMKAQVQRVQDAAGAGHAKEGFQVARVVPHHRGHALAGLQSKIREGSGEPPGAAVEIAEALASDGLVRLARDDLNARKNLPGALQNRGQRQREVHHGAAHRASRARERIGRILPLNLSEGEGKWEPPP